MAQSKKGEWKKYIAVLKASGKYEEFLAKKRARDKKSRLKRRELNPEKARERDRKSYHGYVERLKADSNPEKYREYLERRKERDRIRYKKRIAKLRKEQFKNN